MSNVRVIVLAAVVALVLAPSLSALLAVTGHLEPAGVLTGLAAGFLLRRQPSTAALATLYGSASAVLIGELFAEGLLDETDFADAMAGWPGWVLGAVLAYLIAAQGLPRGQAGAVKPAVLPMGAAALIAAVLSCAQIVAGKAFGMTEWVDYHPYDGPGWYRDLTSATWYPAASVVLASMIASRMPGGRGRFVVLPLAAWFGCAMTAGPVQYAQALGLDGKPAVVALLASLAGSGIGAAAAAAALRHGGTGLGLVSFVLVFTAGEVTGVWMKDLPLLWSLVGPLALIAVVAAWTAWRDASLRSGVVAGVAGPLLVWSVYLTIGSRNYDHSSQSWPYWLALLTALMALLIALTAAGLARLGRATRTPV
ncbi:hypothetical protein ABZ297_07350 [Nonomuraea sp. NPDC005983]|uniref:hypothetical protein n=1 Tax=Nonomuraea sp. NPDC005983 TaxID=3155595 RepID=UPI0033BF9F4E